MQITLIRHGKPEFELNGKVSANEIPRLIQNYNESGITGSAPDKAIKQAATCNVVICSDLYRSLHSAEALDIKEIHLSYLIFREIDMPHFKKGSIRLPVNSWAALFRIMSLFGFAKNGESFSMARKRAKDAAARLINIACEHKHVMLVGHGFINYLIAKELLSSNWTGPAKPGKEYWDYGVYQYKV